MSAEQAAGDRPNVTGAGLRQGGALPWHLRPEKDQCVIIPVSRIYRSGPDGRVEYVQPGQIRCSCGRDHSVDNPSAQPYRLEELPEATPGWTVQQAQRPAPGQDPPYAGG